MAGHSKWKNIMHKKAKTDAQRANVFTKIGKEIAIAVREGGADPVSNSKLKDLIQKAKSNNVPNDNIDRVIKKAAGGEGEQYEYITYEGYGPGGVAVIVETTTDNRNRTAGDIRHFFSKYSGNMGATGCVSFVFSETGIIVIESGDICDEEKLMEDALESGASDFISEEDIFEIHTRPADLIIIRDILTGKGYNLISAEVEKIPSTHVKLEDDQIIKMQKLLDAFENNDDVQNVWHNWDE